MDILNFISWIRGGRVVTSVDPAKTLLPVGLKDGRRDDDYLAGAISVTDFAAQVGGLQTVAVDGVTITGDGTPGDPLVAAGGGGFDPTNVEIVEVNVINAIEGTSIPNGASDSYIKTIPLGFTTPATKALAVISVNSVSPGSSSTINNSAYTYGVSSQGTTSLSVNSINKALDTSFRMLVTSDYTETLRAQLFLNETSIYEEDENAVRIPTNNILSYTDHPTLFGVYSSNKVGIGYTSSNQVLPQTHSVIKSAYLSGNNLVIMFKKRAATSGETFSTGVYSNTAIYLRVYKLA